MFKRLYHTEDKPENQDGPSMTPMVSIIEEQKHDHEVLNSQISGSQNFSHHFKSFQDNSVSNAENLHMQRIAPRDFNLENEDDPSAVAVDLSELEEDRKGDEWNSVSAHRDHAADFDTIQTPINPAVNTKLK